MYRAPRRSRDVVPWVPRNTAILGTIVAYQLNNALHLALNWVVIGAAVALTARDASTNST